MAESSASPTSADQFQRQITIATLGLLFVVLIVHLLKEFAGILQPLLIALFMAYVLMPIHRWLVRRGIGSRLAFVVILALLLILFVGVGQAVYSSVTGITQDKLDIYRGRVNGWVDSAA